MAPLRSTTCGSGSGGSLNSLGSGCKVGVATDDVQDNSYYKYNQFFHFHFEYTSITVSTSNSTKVSTRSTPLPYYY